MNGLVKEGSLGAILFKSQIITEQDIKAALDEQQASGCRFGEALVKLGVVTQEDIDWALSNQLNIPYVRLKQGMIDQDAVELIPATVARQYNLIPLLRMGDDLSLAMADPLNMEAIGAVEELTGCQVTVSVALIREIREMQDICYGPAEVATSLGFAADCFPERVLAEINADLTGARLLDYLLVFVNQNKATGLSLQPVGDTVGIAVKRAGKTRHVGTLAGTYYPDFVLRLKKLAKIDDTVESAAGGELGFRYKGAHLSFQILLLRGVAGDFVTIKPQAVAPFPARLADLGSAAGQVTRLRGLAASESGLVLVVHRDSEDRCRLMDLFLEECSTIGKSVLLLGNDLGKGSKHFPRIPLPNGATGEAHDLLLAALEHDPDIIVVEDATDSLSFIAATKAAMRGKLVVAGISSPDMDTAFKHLLYLWHRHYFVPTCLRGMISCKGVAILCPHCRGEYSPTREEIAALRLAAPSGNYFRAAGCPACDQTGHKGRRYLLDLITFEEGLLAAFESARDSRDIERYLQGAGYRGIMAEGEELLQAGEISPVEYVASLLL
ncbi:pilus assembly protein PilB [Geobacter sp. AOG1]|uniref:ATPase, T2SS/T4P/T4SS family n=1 Tax=Geobacter sp. AOG1 TaxID=1566346 RepID=UPI001CC4CF35|nr:pilus assembly protein PilB [Geobacter sp. AOG1]GFE56919.1 general secretory pathway protein GspE [Geobacter sp. AOG1]